VGHTVDEHIHSTVAAFDGILVISLEYSAKELVFKAYLLGL
jgi:hypothetical protein